MGSTDDRDDWQPGEPLPTGFVQIALSGERSLAQSHLRDARRLLGRLRATHGIDARIAAGEAGGFFTRTVNLTDGTRVTVTSNDGRDTVRIDAPLRLDWPEPAAADTPAAPSQPVETALPRTRTHVSHLPPLVPPPPEAGAQEDSGTEDEDTVDYTPYLWIGVRVLNPDQYRLCQVHACVWEPALDPSAEPVILSNRNKLPGRFMDRDGEDDRTIYPLGPWQQFTGDDKDNGIAYTDQHLVMLLPHNGYPMRVPDYDPTRDDDIEWDVIFISDPDNDLQLLDQQRQPMAGSGLGSYYLKVMIVGPDCTDNWASPPPPQVLEMRIITGKNEYRSDISHQVTIEEFTQCPAGIMPFGYFSDRLNRDSYPCYGTNPHALHWWQGMGFVALTPTQIGVPVDQLAPSVAWFSHDGEVAVPPTGFDVAGAWPDLCPPPPEPHPFRYWRRTNHWGECQYWPGFDGWAVDDVYVYFHEWCDREVTWYESTLYGYQEWDAAANGYGPITPAGSSPKRQVDHDRSSIFDEDITVVGNPYDILDPNSATSLMQARWRASFMDNACPERLGSSGPWERYDPFAR